MPRFQPGSTKTRDGRIRTLWVAPNFFPKVGGLEIYIEKIVESLADICHAGLVTKAGQWFPGYKEITHFTVSGFTFDSSAGRRQAGEELAHIVSSFAPDIVHLGGAEVGLYREAIPYSVPVVATVHGNDLTLVKHDLPEKGHLVRVVEGLNACQHIFAVSQHTAALCRQWGVVAPLSVVTAGCDIEFFQPRPILGREARAGYGLPSDVPVVLTVSRVVPRKGHLSILEAIRLLPFPVHWVVAGEGPGLEQLMRTARDSGMTDRVSIVGGASDDDLLGLYNACDLFVLTPEERRFNDGRLDSEGFGLVFLEAAACGKPVIGTRISGCRDAIVDGGTGLLVPPADPAALAAAMEVLLCNPETAREFGNNGLELVRASGGWPRLARQLLDKYEELLLDDLDPIEPSELRIPV
jgi:glycosyltransferase involved in cell wall biosynthesis